jgi:hypothetical protein
MDIHDVDMLFVMTFSKVKQMKPDPEIVNDNGLRNPTITLFVAKEHSVPGIVQAMGAGGWTFKHFGRTLEYKPSEFTE